MQLLDHQHLVKDGKEVELDLSKLSLTSIFHQHLDSFPTKPALVHVDPKAGKIEELSYAEFYHQAQALAQYFVDEHQLQAGDSVGLHLENSPEILLTHLACWLLGCKTVPLDLKRDDLDRKKYKLELTNCNLVVTSDKQKNAEAAKLIKSVKPGLKLLPLTTDIRQKLAEEYSHLDPNLINQDPTNIGLVLFTSGTTNLPKGVELSLMNLLLNAEGIKEWLRITAEDRFNILLPLHHINSTTMSLATLLAGGTIVLSSRYTKSGFWQIMAENSCTLSSIVPTICFDMLSEEKQFQQYQDELKLTRLQIGSAPVKPPHVLKFYEKYGIRLIQGYGSTETALRVTGNPFGWEDEGVYLESVKANTIGAEMKWNNTTIIKADGSEADEGEEGEICMRGPVLTRGYLANQAANQKTFVDGWFHSGDIGYWQELHGQQVFFISGRQKEIIIKGGVNISPLPIEKAILEHYPHISSCFVAAFPDERYDEEVAAVVSFEDSVTAKDQATALKKLRADADQQEIPDVPTYETPRHIIEVPLESLPRTSTGKIQRIKIKDYLFNQQLPIAETETHACHLLTPFDAQHIEQLVKIHNQRWGKELGMTIETAKQAITNGTVIGAIEKKSRQLVGSVFAERIHSHDVENKASWLDSYASATGDLTLQPSTSEGDSLLLVTISTQGKEVELSTNPEDEVYQALLQTAPQKIEDYLATNTDPVLRFHGQPKAGQKSGAEVLYPIEAARPADVESLGYCVIVKYPPLKKEVDVDHESSLGTQLLEATFKWAQQQRLDQVYAYSRPSGFLSWLQSQS